MKWVHGQHAPAKETRSHESSPSVLAATIGVEGPFERNRSSSPVTGITTPKQEHAHGSTKKSSNQLE